jgi:general secretion pathway protein I
MVALIIVAFSLTALTASMNQMIDAANTLRERTFASWIAQNKITEMRLANAIPEVSATSGEIEFGNTEWEWRAVVSETGIENFRRIDVSVSHYGAEYVILTVTGFIGEPIEIGRPCHFRRLDGAGLWRAFANSKQLGPANRTYGSAAEHPKDDELFVDGITPGRATISARRSRPVRARAGIQLLLGFRLATNARWLAKFSRRPTQYSTTNRLSH